MHVHLPMQKKVHGAVLHGDQVCDKEKVSQGWDRMGIHPGHHTPLIRSPLTVLFAVGSWEPELCGPRLPPFVSPIVHVSRRQALCWRAACQSSQGSWPSAPRPQALYLPAPGWAQGCPWPLTPGSKEKQNKELVIKDNMDLTRQGRRCQPHIFKNYLSTSNSQNNFSCNTIKCLEKFKIFLKQSDSFQGTMLTLNLFDPSPPSPFSFLMPPPSPPHLFLPTSPGTPPPPQSLIPSTRSSPSTLPASPSISPFWDPLPSFPENATPHTFLPSCIILQLYPTFWLIKCLPNFSLIQKKSYK